MCKTVTNVMLEWIQKWSVRERDRDRDRRTWEEGLNRQCLYLLGWFHCFTTFYLYI